ncbi:hypothetical protein AWB66_02815 [Caballeronia telluris]|uniref:Uncharacterized protein n=1 Tax=Caballeronia telluris TaxID=326475 RepID=A0A158HZG0_9BURK|nr:hypothetical protein AWB66_02815 [Caballeronia telluris]
MPMLNPSHPFTPVVPARVHVNIRGRRAVHV